MPTSSSTSSAKAVEATRELNAGDVERELRFAFDEAMSNLSEAASKACYFEDHHGDGLETRAAWEAVEMLAASIARQALVLAGRGVTP